MMNFLPKILFVSVIVASCSIGIMAQDRETPKGNAIYLELVGMGGFYSINFEHKIGEKIWMRSGLSYLPGLHENLATMPIGLMYIKGSKSKYFEMGVGTTLFKAGSRNMLGFNFKNEDRSIFSASIQGIIGYRYLPLDENFIFKVNVYPAYFPVSKSGFVTLGLSFGYSF